MSGGADEEGGGVPSVAPARTLLAILDPLGRLRSGDAAFRERFAAPVAREGGAPFADLFVDERERAAVASQLAAIASTRCVRLEGYCATHAGPRLVSWTCSAAGAGDAVDEVVCIGVEEDEALEGAPGGRVTFSGAERHYWATMDRVARAIVRASSVQHLIDDVMDEVFHAFAADRAWLLFPCNPDGPSFRVPVEVAKPEFPGAGALDAEVPVDPLAADVLRRALASEGPVSFGPPPNDHPLPEAWSVGATFRIQSQIMVALRPRVGEPWLLGLHQCAHPRVWTAHERRLLRDVAFRVEDAIGHQVLVETLRDSERRYRHLVESLREVVFQADVEGRLVFVNPAWRDATGLSVHETLGRSLVEFLHPDDAPAASAALRDAAASERPPSTVRYLTRAGEVRWAELLLRRDESGRAAVLGTLVDVTTHRHAQEQLRHAKEEAEALSRAKSVFINIASHELRTPLTPLNLMLQQAHRSARGGGRVELAAIERMERSVRRLTTMVNDMLDVSRLERGQLEMRPVRLELGTLARRVVEDFRAQAPARGLDARLPDAPVWVIADEFRLEEVLSNLVDNALKYSPADLPVTVEVAVDGTCAHLSVTDLGPGIAAGDRAKLFSLFSRLDSQYTIRQPGLGIGLYICREIVHRHGGEISVDSEPGRGSTFSLTLPVAD